MAVVLRSKDYTFHVKDSELGLADGGDPNTTYTLRQLTRADYKKALQANTKQTPNPRTRGMDVTVDQVAAEDDLFDYALVGWEGVVLPGSGEPAPCERDLKFSLPPEVIAALLQKAGLRHVQEGDADRQKSFR